MVESWPFQIWASQGGLSRNKVAVGEPAAGSPPKKKQNVRGISCSTQTNLKRATPKGNVGGEGHNRPRLDTWGR
jgi:hypothetical protein